MMLISVFGAFGSFATFSAFGAFATFSAFGAFTSSIGAASVAGVSSAVDFIRTTLARPLLADFAFDVDFAFAGVAVVFFMVEKIRGFWLEVYCKTKLRIVVGR
jgi:hypothetical protein